MSCQRFLLVMLPLFLAAPLLFERTALATDCSPNGNEVCLFGDSYYGGPVGRITLQVDQYGYPSSVACYPTMTANNPLPNDWLSSFKVGANVRLTVCTDSYYGSYCYTYGPNQDQQFLPTRSAPWYCDPNLWLCNDWASSVKVEPANGSLICY